ncbi:RidA family protein [Nocardioides marmoriginsengisoli]|uniref:RidA family protein n=1 Tax=Nocardioides marmoriginsengisoli TaxID=661483 RepID=A0A3N0CHT9_9ACTN|nr:RidA family protein [Nocardioides marmoriginsengisoli]RNL62523.1 RidA family protein [Nocardioides marmoriginsengisoli]
MPRTVATGEGLAPPAGPYSPCVRIGDTIACSGQAAIDADGEIVRAGIERQTEITLANMVAALATAGVDESDVLHVRVYLTDVEHFAPMNKVYETFFSAPYPARTTVYVGLPEGLLVEIDALAVLPEDRR